MDHQCSFILIQIVTMAACNLHAGHSTLISANTDQAGKVRGSYPYYPNVEKKLDKIPLGKGHLN